MPDLNSGDFSPLSMESRCPAVTSADKIGLLPGFGWIAGHNFFATLFVCWLITPGLMFIIAPVLESRKLPWTPQTQFLSFFPGDFFLGMMLALVLWFAQRMPAEVHFYNSTWFHLLLVVVTFTVAIVITKAEYDDPNGYGHRAVLSPTKLYHNIVLYGAYGYVIVATLVAVVAWLLNDGSWRQAGVLGLCLAPGLVWVCLLVFEQEMSEETKESRTWYAHVNDWKPIWSR